MPPKGKIAITIGDFQVRATRRKGCRRLILRYNMVTGEFCLSMPPETSVRTIQAFLESQYNWMEKQSAQKKRQPDFVAGEQHLLLGQWVTLGKDAPTGDAFVKLRDQQLQALLMRQVAEWSEKIYVQVTHITLREMSSRWGSCRKSTGRLTFNTCLGAMPPEAVEYVVVHELCHLIHANHSVHFWQLVERCLPDYRQRKAQLTLVTWKPENA